MSSTSPVHNKSKKRKKDRINHWKEKGERTEGKRREQKRKAEERNGKEEKRRRGTRMRERE